MKKIALFSALVLISFFLQGQTRSGSISDILRNQQNQAVQDDQQRGFRKENLRFGGNLGATFGNTTFIDVSPAIGYQFTHRFQAGLGFIYNYYSFRDRISGNRFSMSIYGVKPYAQFSVLQLSSFHVVLRAEHGVLNYDVNFWFNRNRKHEWVHYPLLGAGVLLPVGRSGGIMIQAMWDLNEKEHSIYSGNPIIQVGFMFGM